MITIGCFKPDVAGFNACAYTVRNLFVCAEISACVEDIMSTRAIRLMLARAYDLLYWFMGCESEILGKSRTE
jgi:hypothetical protein